jgi:signal transduction histidine kinase
MKKLLIILLLFTTSLAANASENLDSLQQSFFAQVRTNGFGAEEEEMLGMIHSYNLRINPLDSYEFYHELITFGIRTELPFLSYTGYSHHGGIYKKLGVPDKALESYLQAMEIVKRDKEYIHVPWNYINIGNLYFSIKYYDRAIENYNKALDWFSQLVVDSAKYSTPGTMEYKNVQQGFGVCYNNLGMIYKQKKTSYKALEYFHKALKKRTEIKDTLGMAYGNYYIGNVYIDLQNYDEATNIFNDAISLYFGKPDEPQLEIEWTNVIGDIYIGLGRIKLLENEVSFAGAYFKKCVETKLEIGYDYGLLNAYREIARAYAESGYKLKAIGNYQLAMSIAEQNNFFKDQTDIYTELAEYHKNQGDLEIYYQYRQKLFNIRDSVLSKNLHNMFDDIETRYSYREQLEDMMNLERENKIQDLELSKKNSTILYLSILAGVVLISAIILIPMFLAKRRLSKELQTKNKEMATIISRLKESEEALEFANADLQTKNINLYNSQDKLQELNATKDKFFSIIAHDLINPLASLKQLSEMLADDFHQMDSVDVEDYLVMIKGASNGVYNLLDNLLTWSRSQRGKINFEPQPTDLNYIIKQNVILLQTQASKKNIKLEQANTLDNFVNCDINMVNTIIRNLISNAIKFTPDGGNIILSVEENSEFGIIKIKDDGVGMDAPTRNRLFRIDKNHTSEGTSGEKGTGLGLILCWEFVEKHGGEIYVISEPDIGSEFVFTLPLITPEED